MTGLPEFFTQTSDVPYDRHQYKFIKANNESIIFDCWDQAQAAWFQTPPRFKSHIEVLDKKTKTKGGFK